MSRIIIIALTTIFFSMPLAADNNAEGMTTPVEPKPVQSDLKLVGEGMMSYLFWDVYLARLYTKSGEYKEEVSDTAIEFNYKLDIKSKALVEETINQWRELDLDEHPEEQQWADALLEIWPDINEGDQLLFHIDASGNANFYYNNEFRGQISSQEFSYRFKSIWLSEDTTAPKVRRKLIGDNKKKR